MKYEGVPVTEGQDTRKGIKNRETKQQFETECKIILGSKINSEHSFQEICGDREIQRSQLNLQRFDRWTSFPCNHFHHLKMISIKLRVGGTLILSIDLIGTKWATVFSLKKENKSTFNCEHTHMAFCLCINTWCACRLFKNVLQHIYHSLVSASCH